MIIVEISGGLGNQMYKYACGYVTALENGQELAIDTTINDCVDFRTYGLADFCIKYKEKFSYKKGKGLLDRAFINKIHQKQSLGNCVRIEQGIDSYAYRPELLSNLKNTTNYYLYGGWQNFRYFDRYREQILKIFTPREKDADIEKIASTLCNTSSVGLHVRRGDYTQIGVELNMEYYNSAIWKLKERSKEKLAFYVFSDDIEYCKAYFSKFKDDKFYYLEYKNNYKTFYDMYLMSKCQNLIIANSSYSWWAAYLNNNQGIIIAPVIGIWKDAIYLDNWERIKAGK